MKSVGCWRFRTKFTLVAEQVTTWLLVCRRPREYLCNSNKTIWISLFLKLADLKLRKVLQLSWLYTFGDEVRILHLPWGRWAFSWLGVQNTSEDSLVWISFCGPSRGCRERGGGDRGHIRFQTCQDTTLRNLPGLRAPVKPVERDRLRQSLLIMDLLSTRSLRDYVVMLLHLLVMLDLISCLHLLDWSIWSLRSRLMSLPERRKKQKSCFELVRGLVDHWQDSQWKLMLSYTQLRRRWWKTLIELDPSMQLSDSLRMELMLWIVSFVTTRRTGSPSMCNFERLWRCRRGTCRTIWTDTSSWRITILDRTCACIYVAWKVEWKGPRKGEVHIFFWKGFVSTFSLHCLPRWGGRWWEQHWDEHWHDEQAWNEDESYTGLLGGIEDEPQATGEDDYDYFDDVDEYEAMALNCLLDVEDADEKQAGDAIQLQLAAHAAFGKAKGKGKFRQKGKPGKGKLVCSHITLNGSTAIRRVCRSTLQAETYSLLVTNSEEWSPSWRARCGADRSGKRIQGCAYHILLSQIVEVLQITWRPRFRLACKTSGLALSWPPFMTICGVTVRRPRLRWGTEETLWNGFRHPVDFGLSHQVHEAWFHAASPEGQLVQSAKASTAETLGP